MIALKNTVQRRALQALISTGLLVSMLPAQTTSAVITGRAVLMGSAQVVTQPPQQNTHVYVFSPPMSNSSGNNNSNFMTSVMTQGAIDGVTVNISWNSVETTTDPYTPCTGPFDDTLQKDSFGYCHTYNWSNVDGTTCGGTAGHGTLLGQFFCSVYSKKVNPLINGITQSNNAATPDYLWHDPAVHAWNNDVGTQDVVNNIKDTACAAYFGYTSPTITLVTINNATHKATVTMTSNPFSMNDIIWTKGFLPGDLNILGATVSAATSTTFTYFCGSSCTSGPITIGNVISSQTSFPLPTETPYKTAFRAFVAAAVYHFSHTAGVINKDQVAYMRVGHAYGAEAYPVCQAQWPQDTTEDAWLSFYNDMNGYLMGITNAVEQQIGLPIFHMQTSINSGGTPGSPVLDYADREAQSSVQYSGGDPRRFGIGTQGLQASDYPVFPVTVCTAGTGDWCMWFNQFWLGGPSYTDTEFELQQIDCSNPTGTNDHGASSCFLGAGGTGKTGDLRTLLPWIAAPQHATILELYAQDALLAYDPHFCDPVSMSCVTSGMGDGFSGLDAGTQYKFYISVGQGSGCGSGTGGGDCSYATAVNATHGMH